jgi:hypothetical protein
MTIRMSKTTLQLQICAVALEICDEQSSARKSFLLLFNVVC